MPNASVARNIVHHRSFGFHDNSFQSDTKCDVHIRKEVLTLCSFTNQVLVQLGLLKCRRETTVCKNGVYLLPEQLGEQVATLHFPALGAALTVFAPKQADDYIVVKDERSFKGGHYRF